MYGKNVNMHVYVKYLHCEEEKTLGAPKGRHWRVPGVVWGLKKDIS